MLRLNHNPPMRCLAKIFALRWITANYPAIAT